MGSEGLKYTANKLQNIDEDGPANWAQSSVSVPPPETPTESMEFLARSWSISATELSKALSTTQNMPINVNNTTFSFAGEKLDVENPILSNTYEVEPNRTGESSPILPRGSDDNKEVEPNRNGESSPILPRGSDDNKQLFLLHQALHPEFLYSQLLVKNGLYKNIIKGKTMGRRMKDQRERKKQEIRTHNARLHAAVSVASVAAAIAALTASNATPIEDMLTEQSRTPYKTPAAIASAAALVASHCIEIAEEMGADHHQILTAVNSATNARTNGDIMTLTAGAATALRGAATLKARLGKGNGAAALALGEDHDEDGKDMNAMTAMNFVLQGGELLKRTRKGALHWTQISFSINSQLQIIVKLKSKHMAGAFTKKKKFAVYGVYTDISAWTGREQEDCADQRSYFGIKTADRIIEFECKNNCEKQMWTDGIHHLLNCRIGMPFP